MLLSGVRTVWLPFLLTALVVGWFAAMITEKSWLFALVLAAVGVADLPVIARVRTRRGMRVATLAHVGVLFVGWFAAFLVWAPFVRWE